MYGCLRLHTMVLTASSYGYISQISANGIITIFNMKQKDFKSKTLKLFPVYIIKQ